MKSLTLAFILVSILAVSSCAQNKPAPDYLTSQAFPDSVKNMRMTNIKGQRISFADMLATHAGKKVVIDIWASWCKDCIVGLPKLYDLMEKTRDKNVSYVFISLDKDETRWKAAISRFNINGENYRIETAWDNPLANYISLDWIPRYVVLDEKSNIIMPKAVHADETVEQALKARKP